MRGPPESSPESRVGGGRKQELKNRVMGTIGKGGRKPQVCICGQWVGTVVGGVTGPGEDSRWCREGGVQRQDLTAVAVLSHFFKQEAQLQSLTARACLAWALATRASGENKVTCLMDSVSLAEIQLMQIRLPLPPFTHHLPTSNPYCQHIGGNLSLFLFFFNLFSCFYPHTCICTNVVVPP